MLKPKKHLGQNFLKDSSVLTKIISSAELSKADTVLEVGPGKGFLTEELIKHAGQVIAVEFDEDLIWELKVAFNRTPNFTLIHTDALKFNPPPIKYKIVANIPYYISSPIINHFLLDQFLNKDGNPPEMLVLMLQKEVAEKIVAKKESHSVLSLQVHLFGTPEIVQIVPRTAFYPAPKVDSAILKITVNKEPKIHGDLKKIMWLFHIAFAQKRKKLSNNLSAALRKEPAEIKAMLKELKINEDLRAENLSFEEWGRLLNRVDVPH